MHFFELSKIYSVWLEPYLCFQLHIIYNCHFLTPDSPPLKKCTHSKVEILWPHTLDVAEIKYAQKIYGHRPFDTCLKMVPSMFIVQLEFHLAKLATSKPSVYRKEFLSHLCNFKCRSFHWRPSQLLNSFSQCFNLLPSRLTRSEWIIVVVRPINQQHLERRWSGAC